MSLSIGADADSAIQLSRAAGDARPVAPVRIMHLGLGKFSRAHQAFHTDMAPDIEQWRIAARWPLPPADRTSHHRRGRQRSELPGMDGSVVDGSIRSFEADPAGGARLPSINYQSIEEGHAHVDDVGLRR